MGLDMNLYGNLYFLEASDDIQIKSFENLKIEEIKFDLGYWRRYHTLHQYIVNNFANGVDDCHSIQLHEKDLNTIISNIKNDFLVDDFISDEYYDELKQSTIKIFEAAIHFITEVPPPGKYTDVTYRACW